MQDTVGIRNILKKFKVRLQNLYGNKFSRLILYGSYARGEFVEDSDIDLAIILKGEISPFKEIDRMSEITYDLVLKYDILISIHPVSEERYLLMKTPFLMNIREEGIQI
ncbi:MAG: nucleotidyltransferase domain-containing protein [Promethearchaeota archaeon]|nr:MAG: nucleotidyltransferase domain-containing protein [Candidatus Lokiarchaeota archaeon]